MKINLLSVILMSLAIIFMTSINIKPQEKIERKELGVATFGAIEINKVDAREITIAPLVKSGSHYHPGAVIGYVIEGAIFFQVDGEEPKTLKSGDSFYEPAGRKILHFDNKSKRSKAKFIAFYLLKDGQELIVMSDK